MLLIVDLRAEILCEQIHHLGLFGFDFLLSLFVGRGISPTIEQGGPEVRFVGFLEYLHFFFDLGPERLPKFLQQGISGWLIAFVFKIFDGNILLSEILLGEQIFEPFFNSFLHFTDHVITLLVHQSSLFRCLQFGDSLLQEQALLNFFNVVVRDFLELLNEAHLGLRLMLQFSARSHSHQGEEQLCFVFLIVGID